MYNVEEVHCAVCINAVIRANQQLMSASVEEVLRKIEYGKTDTLGLDGIPESAIEQTLHDFDREALLVTEEIGLSGINGGRYNQRIRQLLYLSDPTDRSSQLKGFLSKMDPSKTVGDVVQDDNIICTWESLYSSPASITGATSAITCIRDSIPIATAILNFITQELFVAYSAGVFRLQLPPFQDLVPSKITLEYITSVGERLFFRGFTESESDIKNMRYFATYMVGKSGYQENFRDSDLIRPADTEKYLRYGEPGGPSRPLYLSTIEPANKPVGFILANGEKIGEWIHWLPFVRFGKIEGATQRHGLMLYEIYQLRPWTKDGILMATSPVYSLFSQCDSQERKMVIDVDKMRWFPNPSRIRSTLLIAPSSNSWARTVMAGHLYRRIEFPNYSDGP
jgi:hypothetical protein